MTVNGPVIRSDRVAARWTAIFAARDAWLMTRIETPGGQGMNFPVDLTVHIRVRQ